MMTIIFLVAMVTIQEPVYSGLAHVDGLGEIAFPSGEWVLEHRTKPGDDKRLPDAYVFKRKGDRLERLSFKRIAPRDALSIECYFGSIGDLMSNGIPMSIVGMKSEHDTAHILSPVQDWRSSNGNVVCKGSSYAYSSEKNEPWMSHAFVCSVDGWVIVACHASPHALSPEDTQNLYSDSSFKPIASTRK